MYCENCGAEISKEAYICPKCGVKVKKEENIEEMVDILEVIRAILEHKGVSYEDIEEKRIKKANIFLQALWICFFVLYVC